jgi:hypothetical protein
VTPERAVAEDRAATVREIDRMLDNVANRNASGPALLRQLKLWLMLREQKET